MQVGLIGLGKMGRALARAWSAGGHAVVGTDIDPEMRTAAVEAATAIVPSVSDLGDRLQDPRVFWVMVPHAQVDGVLQEIRLCLRAGDCVVDGGNSPYALAEKRAQAVAAAGALFLDVGVSGGPHGDAVGFSLMVGGTKEAFQRVEPLLVSLAQPSGAYAHLGPVGAGHFVKMVHNGVEYGMMESVAEGIDVLAHGPYARLKLADVAAVWQRGSVVRSFLMDLLADILATENMDTVRGTAAVTGEGEWTVETARAHGVDIPAIAAAVARRKESQRRELFAAKILALLRARFGGHPVERAGSR